MISILVYSFVSLRELLVNHQFAKWLMIRKRLYVYFICEFLLIFTVNEDQINNIVIAQAIIIIFIKSSQDPIQGISKLKSIVIVSTNQKVTTAFIDKMIQGTAWRQLNDENKEKVAKFISDQSSLSSLPKSSVASFYRKSID